MWLAVSDPNELRVATGYPPRCTVWRASGGVDPPDSDRTRDGSSEAQMIEIIVLVVLLGMIGDMARRRGRSSSRFGLLLVVGWFGGEIAGGVLGSVVSRDAAGKPNMLVVYGFALCGAAIGAGLVFLFVLTRAPVGGVWRDLSALPVRRSRLLGAVVGGVGGGAIGALVVVFMYGAEQTEGNLPLAVQGCLAVGFIGALLGLVSGVQKE